MAIEARDITKRFGEYTSRSTTSPSPCPRAR